MQSQLSKLDKSLPIVSLLGLFIYFLFDGFFTSTTGSIIFTIVSVILVASDLIFRVVVQGFSKKLTSRLVAGGLGLGSILNYLLRGWLDFPSQPGVNIETTAIPKVREFLLALTVVFAIAFFAYTVLLEIGRRSLEAQSQLSDKKHGLLQNTVIGFLLLLPILVAVNYVAIMRNYNFDLSSVGKFSLSPITKNILKDVKTDVEIIGFYPRPLEADGPGGSLSLSRVRPDVEILLDQYKSASSKIKIRFINADVETDLLQGMGQVSNGNILIRSPREMLPGESNAYNEEKVAVREKEDLEDLERKLTAAILNVTTPKRKVYFTSANGERYGLAFKNLKNEQITTFASSLNYLNFQLNELGFAEGWPKDVPEDADLVVLAGPTAKLSEKAQSAILDYVIKRKGKVFVSIEPKGNEDFSWLLEKAGIRFDATQMSQEKARPNLIVAKKFPEHPISDFLAKKEIGIVYPHGGFLETFSDGTNPFQFTSKFFLESGAGVYLDPQGTGKMAAGDEPRNFKLGAVLKTIPESPGSDPKIEEEGRVVVFSGT
ncbi:MAG: GldG family protein, partial [Leptospira sp.]|nr:GldG family protein [Leptospira sp.]